MVKLACVVSAGRAGADLVIRLHPSAVIHLVGILTDNDGMHVQDGHVYLWEKVRRPGFNEPRIWERRV